MDNQYREPLLPPASHPLFTVHKEPPSSSWKIGCVLPNLEMGRRGQKGSVTGPGSGKSQSWESNLSLWTLGLNETVHAEGLHGILKTTITVVIIIISEYSF